MVGEMRILLVDDDRDVAEYVRRELEEESFNVVVAHDGAAGLRLAESSAFDILVLDVMMPFMDGLQLTRQLNRQDILTPILLLTGRDAPEEIVRGLEAGADDYLTKPFSFDVLVARIRARTRRLDEKNTHLRFADLTLDAVEHKAWRAKRAVPLTRTEFAILECLLRSAGPIRIGGALFTGLASAGWIAERLVGVHSSVDFVMDRVAHRAVWIAGIFFLMSASCWLGRNVRNNLAPRNDSPELTPECAGHFR